MKLPRPKFSLRTLALLLFLITSSVALYYDQLIWHCEHVLRGHEGTISSGCFSPDGKRVLTASADTTARIWDTISGKCLAVLAGHSDTVHYGIFLRDGSRVATVSDNEARIWDASTGDCVHVLGLGGPGSAHVSVAFSPDGEQVLIDDSLAGHKLLSTGNGQLLSTFGAMWGMWFSSEGDYVTASKDGGDFFDVHDAKTGAKLGSDCIFRTPEERIELRDPATGESCGFVSEGDLAPWWLSRKDWEGQELDMWEFVKEKGPPRGTSNGTGLLVHYLGPGRLYLTYDGSCAKIWRFRGRRSIVSAVEFWATPFFAALLLCSILRDRKTIRRGAS